MMEEQYHVDRARLRQLMRQHPDWKQGDFVQALGRSVGWVKKWRKRLREAAPDDEAVLWGQSRARKQPIAPRAVKVIDRILEIRDAPPEDLKRVPGPKTILYDLHRDSRLTEQPGLRVPRSTKTIWQILKAYGRIAVRRRGTPQPLERPAPMAEWQLDFKDVSSVPPDPDGKQRHVVETLNIVDAGTSILVEASVREDFNAETALSAVAEVLADYGLPKQVTIDRDPRWVGSSAARDFPSPFLRFCHCLGVQPKVCPPRQPQKNPFVERYNGTYSRECLDYYRPTTLADSQSVTEHFKQHYNTQRPNQALSCGNQPPQMAFPQLPSLPRLPDLIDPEAWLQAVHDQRFIRKVRRDGTVVVDQHSYYIKQQLRGQYVS